MSQKPGTLRVRVNCFLPGTLGREPRSLSQRLQQSKHAKHFKYSEKENALLGFPEQAGRGEDKKQR